MTDKRETVILIIDDEAAIRQSYTDYLEDLNYKIFSVENGKTGIEIFNSEKIDLVLLDLWMPEIGGLEIIDIMSRSKPDVPIIVVSGTRSIDDAVEAFHRGAWDYLLKPLEKMNILKNAVGKALEKVRLKVENSAYQQKLEEMVSDRTKALEEAFNDINNSKIQLERILDDINTGIVIIEKATMKIVYVNPSAAEMHGNEADKILGLQCGDVLCPTGHKSCPIIDLGQDKDSTERVLLRADGTEIPILKTVTHTPFNGKECLLESFVDLTSQKRIAEENSKLELQLRQAQKLESIGTLAGGVAHDFNNLLAGIMGAAGLLEELVENDKEAKEFVRMIVRTSDRAADLTSKLLAFSRRSDMPVKPVNCHESIMDSVTILEHTLDKRINIHLDLNAEYTTVLADPSALQNTFINLGVNAGHSMSKGGRITIMTENITLDENTGEFPDNEIESGSYIRICFEDNGCGMNREVLDRIFEPFFTTKEMGQGTGLGLAAVYGIIKEIDGYIYVDSEIDVGTVFKIFLPLSSYEKVRTESNLSELKKTEESTILIIEDEEVIRHITEIMLRKLGYNVICGSDGDEGLKIYEEKKDDIDLVMIDMVMPGKNGQECFDAVRELNPTAKILLVSGFSKSHSLDAFLDDENSEFIKKPYKLKEISGILNRLINE